jgi:two-component system, cell cycle sensor histidine kinase and response regulator CckA
MAKDRRPSRKSPLRPPSIAEDILHAVQTIVVVANRTGQIVYASEGIATVLGYAPEEMLGEGWWTKVHRPDRMSSALRREQAMQEARGDIPVRLEPYTSKLYTSSGEERWILWQDAKGPGDLVIGTGNDITKLHRAEEEIESRGHDFRAIFDGASDGMLILNSDWIYNEANPGAERIFGIPAQTIVGKEHGQLLQSTIDVAALREEALDKGTVSAETEFTCPDGQKRQVEYTINANFRPGHHLIILRDITDRRALERQLAQAQRLEAIGQLAGGVAHDFNNMLTAIRGYGDLLLKKFPEGGHRRYVEGILDASERAAQTTRQLLAFSRRQVMQPKLLDLNKAIRGLIDLLAKVIGEDVELIQLLSDDVGMVLVDPGQFAQMLMNLAVNSRDAMPGGGKLIIETRSVLLDDEYVLKHIQVEAGDYAMLAVTDTGMGIPEEVRPRIFEPFFTTKPLGKGSGLGLSTVYGIAKQSGGYVWVYSEPGEGTTFKIYLPKAVSSKPNAEGSAPCVKRILLIEDDVLIRSLAATVLRDKGHEVFEAQDGSKALALCQDMNAGIDLVITDIGAPNMSGEDLMGYFAVKFPNVAVIHMSGFSLSYLNATHAVPLNSHFLAKPFTVQQLLEKVQAALEQNQGSSLE